MSAYPFRVFIEERSVKIPESGCWIWERSCQKQGYGDFRRGGKHYLAHRASYEAFVGHIPDGMHVLHKCDVRPCVNPNHLFVGTNADNIQDSVSKGRRKGVTRKRPSGLTYKPWSDSAKESKRSVPMETRLEIGRMRAAGLSFQKIANAVNVSIGTAFRISKEQK